MQQHRLLVGLDRLAVQRQNAVTELIQVCGDFMRRIEEEKDRIVSAILPVAILISASRKTHPNEDPYATLKRYRYHKNPNAENVLVLSKLFDIYEYTESVKEMLADGAVPEHQIGLYKDALVHKLQEKEELAKDITFATIDEIDKAFACILNCDEEGEGGQ